MAVSRARAHTERRRRDDRVQEEEAAATNRNPDRRLAQEIAARSRAQSRIAKGAEVVIHVLRSSSDDETAIRRGDE
jgi:hypothetical protein